MVSMETRCSLLSCLCDYASLLLLFHKGVFTLSKPVCSFLLLLLFVLQKHICIQGDNSLNSDRIPDSQKTRASVWSHIWQPGFLCQSDECGSARQLMCKDPYKCWHAHYLCVVSPLTSLSLCSWQMIRGRICHPNKPDTFNQLWTVEEQVGGKRITSFLMVVFTRSCSYSLGAAAC